MMGKMPSAEMVVSTGVDFEVPSWEPTCELRGSHPQGFQFIATPDERSSLVSDTSVVEDQNLERRS